MARGQERTKRTWLTRNKVRFFQRYNHSPIMLKYPSLRASGLIDVRSVRCSLTPHPRCCRRKPATHPDPDVRPHARTHARTGAYFAKTFRTERRFIHIAPRAVTRHVPTGESNRHVSVTPVLRAIPPSQHCSRKFNRRARWSVTETEISLLRVCCWPGACG